MDTGLSNIARPADQEPSRRAWMLLAAGMGAMLVLSACGKKNNNDDDDEDPPPPVT